MQLLEHGADVHNHGSKSYQTPLRMAVTDLNMDVGMVDLLVSYGASPFLEAKDGKHAGQYCTTHCLQRHCACDGQLSAQLYTHVSHCLDEHLHRYRHLQSTLSRPR